MTDLLQRYLTSVERRLPKAQAKDIVAELREVLTAKIEAEEGRLGRAATADDVAAILKAYGHPVVVASRYAGFDYLIGPSYYPWFWHVQRIAVGLTIAITFAIVAVRSLGADEPFRAAFRGFGGAVQAALICFGVVSLLFIMAERTKLDMNWARQWDPRMLPRDHIREPKSLLETFISLVFTVIWILFWVRAVQVPAEIPVKDGGAVGVHLSDAWTAIYWPVLALFVGALLVQLADLIHPAWSPARAVASIIGHAGGLGVVWILVRSSPLIGVTPVDGAGAAQAEKIFEVVDGLLHISLALAGLVGATKIGVEIWRLWRSARPPAAPSMEPGVSA